MNSESPRYLIGATAVPTALGRPPVAAPAVGLLSGYAIAVLAAGGPAAWVLAGVLRPGTGNRRAPARGLGRFATGPR
jgi:hypothetical protein